MGHIDVRWRLDADTPEMVRIDRQSFAKPMSPLDFHKLTATSGLCSLVATSTYRKIERVVGYILYFNHHKFFSIHRIAVEGESRRMGVGERLVFEVVQKLASNRQQYITARVPTVNEHENRYFGGTSGPDFFEKLGFKSESLCIDGKATSYRYDLFSQASGAKAA